MSLKVTKEIINERLCNLGKDIKLVGEYQKAKIKTLFQCGKGHTWLATPDNVQRRSNCPTCEITNHKIRSLSLAETKDNFNKYLVSNNRNVLLVGEYTRSWDKTLFQCLKCDNQWLSKPNNIKNGKGCPACASYGFNPIIPAWEYGFTRDNYLKYGITNDLNRRLIEHKKYGGIKLVHERYHSVGQFALDWENKVKKFYGGNFASKEKCPMGWTETLPLSLIYDIKNIV